MDVSFESSHGNLLRRSSEHRLDSSPEEGHFEQSSHDGKRTEYAEICHTFYDPIVEYMERLGNGND